MVPAPQASRHGPHHESAQRSGGVTALLRPRRLGGRLPAGRIDRPSALARGGSGIEKRAGNQWGVIIGVIVLIFASVLFAQSDTGKRVGAPDGSTYSTYPEGLSAIYAVFQKEGLGRRWEREIRRLPPDVDRLVIWAANELDDEEWGQLEQWVSAGNTAIIGASRSTPQGGSYFHTSPGTAASAAAHPATAGVETVSVGEGAFKEPGAGALTHLTLAEGHPVLVSWPVGRGRIYWSADELWLMNGRVGEQDNLSLALNLLTPAPGKQVAFDEYHHGYEAADRWWQLLRGNLQWFVIVLGLATLVLFWAYGTRFGAPVPTPAGPSRASVEYVFSMSQLYRRARARSVVQQNLRRTLIRDLSRLLGGAEGLSDQELAQRAAERTGLAAERILDALQRTDPGHRVSDKDLISLAQEVEAIQRSVHNAGFRDQQRPGTGTR